MLSVYGVNDETPLYREVLQGTLAELAGVCAIIALYLCVIRKKLAAAAVYKLSYSNKKVITGLFLACPLVVFLYANIVKQGELVSSYECSPLTVENISADTKKCHEAILIL